MWARLSTENSAFLHCVTQGTQTFGMGEEAVAELIVGCNSLNVALQWLHYSEDLIVLTLYVESSS